MSQTVSNTHDIGVAVKKFTIKRFVGNF